ncbi:MAG TPA: Lrp/AsnC ligand binding domain-containing protein [Candidatus Thermoplasmatota archaeon]|nr:Lrp/AsnC ligand binding domain-containing protein [Candidatus Thermoplasmatota archaeon]
MVTAIVLVAAQRDSIPETAEALAAVSFAGEVYSVTGEWDIVAILRLPRYEDLADVVTNELRHVPGIVKTSTMLAFRTHSQSLLDRGFGIGLEENSSGEPGESGV